MTYHRSFQRPHVSYDSASDISPLTTRDHFENAVPSGTVASRVKFLQDLDTSIYSAPPSPIPRRHKSSPSGFGRRISNQFARPSPRKLNPDVVPLVNSSHSYFGHYANRSNHTEDHAFVNHNIKYVRGRGLNGKIEPQGMTERVQYDAASPWAVLPKGYQNPLFKSLQRDYTKNKMDIINEVNSPSTHTDSLVRTPKFLVSSTGFTDLSVQEMSSIEQLDSRSRSRRSGRPSARTSSTTRRESVRDLFNYYQIERPRGLASSEETPRPVEPCDQRDLCERLYNNKTENQRVSRTEPSREEMLKTEHSRSPSGVHPMHRQPVESSIVGSENHMASDDKKSNPVMATQHSMEKTVMSENRNQPSPPLALPLPLAPKRVPVEVRSVNEDRQDSDPILRPPNSHSKLPSSQIEVLSRKRPPSGASLSFITPLQPRPPAVSKAQAASHLEDNRVQDREEISTESSPLPQVAALTITHQSTCSRLSTPDSPLSECGTPTCHATHSGHTPYRHSMACTNKRRHIIDETDSGYAAGISYFEEIGICLSPPPQEPHSHLIRLYPHHHASEAIECHGYPHTGHVVHQIPAASEMVGQCQQHLDDFQCEACQSTHCKVCCCSREEHHANVDTHQTPNKNPDSAIIPTISRPSSALLSPTLTTKRPSQPATRSPSPVICPTPRRKVCSPPRWTLTPSRHGTPTSSSSKQSIRKTGRAAFENLQSKFVGKSANKHNLARHKYRPPTPHTMVSHPSSVTSAIPKPKYRSVSSLAVRSVLDPPSAYTTPSTLSPPAECKKPSPVISHEMTEDQIDVQSILRGRLEEHQTSRKPSSASHPYSRTLYPGTPYRNCPSPVTGFSKDLVNRPSEYKNTKFQKTSSSGQRQPHILTRSGHLYRRSSYYTETPRHCATPIANKNPHAPQVVSLVVTGSIPHSSCPFQSTPTKSAVSAVSSCLPTPAARVPRRLTPPDTRSCKVETAEASKSRRLSRRLSTLLLLKEKKSVPLLKLNKLQDNLEGRPKVKSTCSENQELVDNGKGRLNENSGDPSKKEKKTWSLRLVERRSSRASEYYEVVEDEMDTRTASESPPRSRRSSSRSLDQNSSNEYEDKKVVGYHHLSDCVKDDQEDFKVSEQHDLKDCDVVSEGSEEVFLQHALRDCWNDTREPTHKSDTPPSRSERRRSSITGTEKFSSLSGGDELWHSHKWKGKAKDRITEHECLWQALFFDEVEADVNAGVEEHRCVWKDIVSTERERTRSGGDCLAHQCAWREMLFVERKRHNNGENNVSLRDKISSTGCTACDIGQAVERDNEDEEGLGILGITVVVHMEGKEDLVVKTKFSGANE